MVWTILSYTERLINTVAEDGLAPFGTGMSRSNTDIFIKTSHRWLVTREFVVNGDHRWILTRNTTPAPVPRPPPLVTRSLAPGPRPLFPGPPGPQPRPRPQPRPPAIEDTICSIVSNLGDISANEFVIWCPKLLFGYGNANFRLCEYECSEKIRSHPITSG